MALQVLSTRHGFTLFGKSHWLSLLDFGGGGGGTSTLVWAEAFVDKPRESVQVALTVIGPADAPVVVTVATLPLPETVPPVEDQPETETGTPSGLVQLQVTVTGVPACAELGSAEQVMVGGFFGGSFTV
jgi:hypothetical protein